MYHSKKLVETSYEFGTAFREAMQHLNHSKIKAYLANLTYPLILAVLK